MSFSTPAGISYHRAGGGKSMLFIWRRAAWFGSFTIAIVLAIWMRTMGYGWPATLSVALIVCLILSFVISQLFAALVLARLRRYVRETEGLTERIAEAVKGLPPEEQEKIANRMIDESSYNRKRR